MTTASTFAGLTGTYAFDVAHSRIGFVARHAMVTKVRGSFNQFEGSAIVDADDPSQSSVSVTIQAASIDTRQPQRDEHVRSNDFLDIPNHPEITFASTSVKHTGGNDFEVTGNLSIRGVTNEISFPIEFQGSAKDPMGNQRIGFEGSTEISRKDYGVTFNAPLETGGVLISDKVTLEFEISAIKSS
jgi:polyisoprenoid-binding protein YceI